MIVRLDKRLFEILNEMGVRIDHETFVEAYSRRKAEKNNDPKQAKKRKLTQMTHDLMSGIGSEI
ncbi:hypothetical protein PSI19_21135 [Xenorhabdus khoisanae]|uniref:hypothetical protein n=1 Tax=Xenorhabdus khoisanae TaxID=880157 RepID=UPI0023594E3D|nr:hypothetical protein [Xenorhabdus khoisanae]MDC9616301.1 hypothetical protein [Xenorhabdus khoisanae]